MLLVGYLLGMTLTRIAWIAAVVIVIYLVSQSHRWLLPLVVGGLVAASAVPAVTDRMNNLWQPEPIPGVPGNSMSWRWSYWQQLLPLWRRSPLNGIGLEVVPTMTSSGLQPHSVWVQSLVEMGIVGLLALCLVLLCFVWTTRIRIRTARSAAELVAARVAGAIGIALLVMTFTENLLSETTTLWYAAAAMGGAMPASASRLSYAPLPPLRTPSRRLQWLASKFAEGAAHEYEPKHRRGADEPAARSDLERV